MSLCLISRPIDELLIFIYLISLYDSLGYVYVKVAFSHPSSLHMNSLFHFHFNSNQIVKIDHSSGAMFACSQLVFIYGSQNYSKQNGNENLRLFI